MSTFTKTLDDLASFGRFECTLAVWKRTKTQLSKEGIKFTSKNEKMPMVTKGKELCSISWKDCTVPDLPDNWVLDKVIADHAHSDSPLKTGQILWLRAMDFQRAKARAEAKDKAEAETKAAK